MSAITEDQYRKLKREVEDAKAESDKAKGALSQLMEQLKKEFDCDTLKDAKALLEDLEAKKNKAQRKFEEALEDYRKKWKT